MSRINELLEQSKKMVEAVGKQASGVIEKAMPNAEKKINDMKGRDGELSERTKAEKTVDKSGVTKLFNSVIDGSYLQADISEQKGIIYVGEKEISVVNCESYETQFSSELVDSTKELFSEYRKKSLNPLSKLHIEKYLIIRWRNGEQSTICVDVAKYNHIVKILS